MRTTFKPTSLQGYLKDVTYAELVEEFGEPHRPEVVDKVRVEWNLNLDGARVTIYDYKERTPIEDFTNWHVGGEGRIALLALEEHFPGRIVRG